MNKRQVVRHSNDTALALEREREAHDITMRDLQRVRGERNALSKLVLDRGNEITALTLRARTAEARIESLTKELAHLRRFLKGSRYG